MKFPDIVALEEATEVKAYAKLPVAPARGEGSWITDEDGERWLDLYGGHAVAITGHCHPRVVAAIREQAGKLLFYSNVARSAVRARASERLLAHAPRPGTRVFYCNSGAEANETAMKIARRAASGSAGRLEVISFIGSFHGRTVATISATGIPHYREHVRPLLPHHTHIPFDDIAALRAAVTEKTAAVLLEPIQSIGGAATASADFYRACADVCRERGALLIFDELQTGLGRTGRFFFGDHFGIAPDMITLAKGLASGVPCGATLVSAEVAATVKVGDQGSTFGGGPLAMAAMDATIAAIDDEGLCENARAMGRRIRAGLSGDPHVLGIRGMGLLMGIELDRPAAQVQSRLLERRIITGTSGVPHVLRLLPPLTLRAEEVDQFLAALAEVLS